MLRTKEHTLTTRSRCSVRRGDLVSMDTPGQRVHGMIGVVVARQVMAANTWSDTLRFSYEVLVNGEIWRCSYSDLLEMEEDWQDEAR